MITSVKFESDDSGASWRFVLSDQKQTGQETELYRSSRRLASLPLAFREAQALVESCDRHGVRFVQNLP